MAKDYSFAGYSKSGFSEATGIKSLQEQLSTNYNRTNDQLRADAQALYKTQYDGARLGYQSQLEQLSTYHDADVDKINKTYDMNSNAIDRNLLKRGLGRSSLISTQGVINENARNAEIADKSMNYLQQENQINNEMQQLDANYAQNIEKQFAELRDTQLAQRLETMMKVAQLQQSGYDSYVQYLLNK